MVYVGAGSHASFFSPGEYLTELALKLPGPVTRTADALRDFWRRTLRQYAGEGAYPEEAGRGGSFLIPCGDYARRDGGSLGPGGRRGRAPARPLADPVPARNRVRRPRVHGR